MKHEPDTAIGGRRLQFPTTRHSLVQAAAGRGPESREALESTIALYWKPAYKHVRMHWNRSNEEAKDLVQGFFATLVEQDILSKFDRRQGKLRTYLRACLDRFVMKQDESANRLKRGGGVIAPFDFETAEREIAVTAPSAEDIFLREWQREMFSLAIDDFRAACTAAGKLVQHRIFEQYDLGDSDTRPSYADLAREHAIPVASVTNYLAWARRELRRHLAVRMDRS